MNYFDKALIEKRQKLSANRTKTKDECLNTLYAWVKQDYVTLEEFKALITWILT